MNILAHRGLWKELSERNTIQALTDACENGFGIETDLREYAGEIIISHDIGDKESPVFESFLEKYYTKGSNLPLALNVKEDGIQQRVKDLLVKFNVTNYYFFDMSIPEMVVYDKMKLAFYTRYSDIEPVPVMYDKAMGVWVDAFFEEFDMVESIKKYLEDNKQVTLISPEIHSKEFQNIWEQLKDGGISDSERFSLCTDIPCEAREYFRGGNSNGNT